MQDILPFEDVSPSEYKRPWRSKKFLNLQLANRLKYINMKKSIRARNCCSIMHFKINPNTGFLKLKDTWYCGLRGCAICDWRKSMRDSIQVNAIINTAHRNYPHDDFIFLTLTCKNCEASSLKTYVRHITRSVNRLFHYKAIRRCVRGYIRSLEITVHGVSNNLSFHPHIHIVIMVPRKYFTNKNFYLNTRNYVTYWRKAMKINYDPVCFVEEIHPNYRKGRDALRSAVSETVKYELKPTDLITKDITRDIKIISALDKGLAYSRRFGFGGILKTIKYNLFGNSAKTDEQSGQDLTHLNKDNTSNDKSSKQIEVRWNFYKHNYFRSSTYRSKN